MSITKQMIKIRRDDMRTLLVCVNSVDDTQRALVEVMNGEECKVIMSGDWYHDKIIEKMDGFYQALNYFGVEYKQLDFKTVTPDEDLFWDLGFIDDCD